MSQFAYDVDASNFEQIVLENSRHTPVVMDFWAEWCGPCKVLKPILEKLAEEYQGKFILAKINADHNQELAAQFGVRGIPSVKAVYNGELLEEFSGAIPEAQVRAFLDRIIPSPAEELRAAANRARAAGDSAQALQLLAEASKLDAGNEEVRLDAADILLSLDQLDEAKRLLDSLSPATRMEDRAQQLIARLTFALGGQQGGDESDLRQRIAADPADMELRMQLANLLVAAGRHAEGLDELIEIVRRDRYWNDDAARKTILAVFNMLGGQGELV
ncbi:MAG: tetratricopeptide repeat protein, partial [Thiobacillaceae bacterium]|nr:tetratricopeptide repeat protein [Thiobacillaceae bacterium]